MFLLCFGHWNVQKHEHDVKSQDCQGRILLWMSQMSGPLQFILEVRWLWLKKSCLHCQVSAIERFYGKDPTRSMLQHASTSTFCGSEIIFSFLSTTFDNFGWWLMKCDVSAQNVLGSVCVFVSGWPSSVWEAIDSYRGCPKLSFRGEMSWDVDIGIEVFQWRWWQSRKRSLGFNRHWAEAGLKTERVENTLKFDI